jgi:hypothetical protein
VKLLIHVNCTGNVCEEDKDKCHLVSYKENKHTPYCLLFNKFLETASIRIPVRCRECKIAEARGEIKNKPEKLS